MVEMNIIGKLSDEDKKHMQDITTINPTERLSYNKKVEKVMAEYNKQGKSFCHHCAISENEEFKKSQQNKLAEKIKMGKPNKELSVDIQEFNPNFKKYNERMKLIGTSEHSKTDKFNKNPTMIIFEDWKCAECGGGQSIEITKTDVAKK